MELSLSKWNIIPNKCTYLCGHSDSSKYVTFRRCMKKRGWIPVQSLRQKKPAQHSKIPHCSSHSVSKASQGAHRDATLYFSPWQPRYITTSSCFLSCGPIRLSTFRVICWKQQREVGTILWSRGGAINLSHTRVVSHAGHLNSPEAWNLNGDYFSGDEVAFFISKLFFRDGFARDGFGFLPLKDVA